MRRIIVLALLLVVFMFATTNVAVATINMPKIDTLNQTLSIKSYVPTGDPIDGPQPPGKQ